MLTSEILKAAKAFLKPETWGKGDIELKAGKLCAGLALNKAQDDRTDQAAAREILHAVATGHPQGKISFWNDRPERTLQDVHDAYDAAIAIAEQQEASTRIAEPVDSPVGV